MTVIIIVCFHTRVVLCTVGIFVSVVRIIALIYLLYEYNNSVVVVVVLIS